MAVNEYCKVEDVKVAFPDYSVGTKYDNAIERLVKTVSRLFDKYTGREPGAYFVDTDVIRYFEAFDSSDPDLLIDELAAAPTEVAVAEAGDITDYTVWASTNYILYPLNSTPYTELKVDILNGTKSNWPQFPKSIKITGKFGYATTVPDEIKEACIIQLIRLLKRMQKGFADTGAIIELAKLTHTKALDPEVGLLIEHYRLQAI